MTVGGVKYLKEVTVRVLFKDRVDVDLVYVDGNDVSKAYYVCRRFPLGHKSPSKIAQRIRRLQYEDHKAVILTPWMSQAVGWSADIRKPWRDSNV